MSRKRTAFLAIIGMCITIDLINWANHSIGNSATVGIAAGVFMVVAYRLGQWTVDERTKENS